MRFVVTFGDPSPRLERETEEAVLRMGRILRHRRERCGMSQRQLAGRAGVDQATISRLERGLSPYSRLMVIARLLAELDASSARSFAPGDSPPS